MNDDQIKALEQFIRAIKDRDRLICHDVREADLAESFLTLAREKLKKAFAEPETKKDTEPETTDHEWGRPTVDFEQLLYEDWSGVTGFDEFDYRKPKKFNWTARDLGPLHVFAGLASDAEAQAEEQEEYKAFCSNWTEIERRLSVHVWQPNRPFITSSTFDGFPMATDRGLSDGIVAIRSMHTGDTHLLWYIGPDGSIGVEAPTDKE